MVGPILRPSGKPSAPGAPFVRVRRTISGGSLKVRDGRAAFGLVDPGAARAWLTEAGYVDVELSEVREHLAAHTTPDGVLPSVRDITRGASCR